MVEAIEESFRVISEAELGASEQPSERDRGRTAKMNLGYGYSMDTLNSAMFRLSLEDLV